MSVYGASFVRARPDQEASFREAARILRESRAALLAASPTNIAVEHTVRASESSDWLSIENAVSDRELEQLSRTLGTTALTLYLVDEKSPRFLYSRLEDGQPVRILERQGERWTRVDGERESWESILFSQRLMDLYQRHAPDGASGLAASSEVAVGRALPYCDAAALAQIVFSLGLPWEPLVGRFSTPIQTEVIPGSPERVKAWLREHERPWWKFWGRD